MALILKDDFKLNDDSDAIVMTEKTGVFVLVTNIGGYGAPNELIGDVLTAVLSVTPPKVTSPIILDLFPTLPSDNFGTFDITEAILGLPVDTQGRWVFKYTITGIGFSYTVTCVKAFFRKYECSVDKLILEIRKLRCSCSSKDIERLNDILDAETLLSAAKKAACCGRISELDDITAELDQIINKTCNC